MVKKVPRNGFELVTTAAARPIAETIRDSRMSQAEIAEDAGISKIALRRFLEVGEGKLTQREFKRETWRRVRAWAQQALSHSSHLGRQSLIEMDYERDLAEILYEIKRRTGWDRLRLYTLAPDHLALKGTLEFGGVRDDFRRFLLPVLTDIPTLELFARGRGCLRFRRPAESCYASAEFAEHGSSQFRPFRAVPQRFIALDYPALERGGSSGFQWLDLACVTSDGQLVGKLTCDCLYQQRIQKEVGMKLPSDVWDLIEKLSERMADHRRAQFAPSFLTEHVGELEDLYWQALSYRALEGHLKNLLVALKWDPIFAGNFDRARLYLRSPLWESYFGKLAGAVKWIWPHEGNSALRGFVEVGGVEKPFVQIVLKTTEDPCTDVFLGGKIPPNQVWFRQRMRSGTPVVFSHAPDDRQAAIPRCHVRYFSHQEGTGRELPPGNNGRKRAIKEHVDLPIPSTRKGELPYGKVTLDNKWHRSTTMPRFNAAQVRALRDYAERMAVVIKAVADWKAKYGELYEGLETLRDD